MSKPLDVLQALDFAGADIHAAEGTVAHALGQVHVAASRVITATHAYREAIANLDSFDWNSEQRLYSSAAELRNALAAFGGHAA